MASFGLFYLKLLGEIFPFFIIKQFYERFPHILRKLMYWPNYEDTNMKQLSVLSFIW